MEGSRNHEILDRFEDTFDVVGVGGAVVGVVGVRKEREEEGRKEEGKKEERKKKRKKTR